MDSREHLWPNTVEELVASASPRIRAQREGHAPKEAVGLVWPDGTIAVLHNRASNSEHEYLVDRREISRTVADKGMMPVAVWHTHWATDARPSEADAKQLERLARDNDRPLMFIYGKDGLRAWTWEDGLEEVGTSG
jgi:proteasome lid subunit RPN8/RPN11